MRQGTHTWSSWSCRTPVRFLRLVQKKAELFLTGRMSAKGGAKANIVEDKDKHKSDANRTSVTTDLRPPLPPEYVRVRPLAPLNVGTTEASVPSLNQEDKGGEKRPLMHIGSSTASFENTLTKGMCRLGYPFDTSPWSHRNHRPGQNLQSHGCECERVQTKDTQL